MSLSPETIKQHRRERLQERLGRYRQRLDRHESQPLVEGVLRRVVGLTIEAVGCRAPVGSHCRVETADGGFIDAEVVGFSGDSIYLMPTGELAGLVPNARVIPTGKTSRVPVGDGLLGRVLDGTGRPLDGAGPLQTGEEVSMTGRLINPLARQPIDEPLDVGIRTINSLLTVGRGQRMGLFAGSGVGKSVLLGMMTRFTEADVIVVGLIGERGREVNEFVQETLGAEGMRRAVVVATPADNPPLMRLQGAWLSTRIAEHFRDQGRKVLLLMDSLTRFAQAQREVALSIGEPPATKGYPPSVFAKLPQLVERAGNGDQGQGSITAFYTVLVEGDDQNDPVADSARAILDGHVVLSRQIAESGLFPAIDVEASVSRAMTGITDEEQQDLVKRFRQLYSLYRQNQDLISVGAYRRGSDPRLDEAVAYWPRIQQFLRQGMNERVSFEGSLSELQGLLRQPAEGATRQSGIRRDAEPAPAASGQQAKRAYTGAGGQ
ncbi:flagellar protein export ATPase FliI [Natronospira bacteriovora]|uniref:Flagellum-specific ATP synthase n=1 Tax=Natronospira bacteriovora TaxID=3069753 RepID=A0ABU0W379_9GAMM|nr:flagellar protein export ATPase FliI [Natronospira sp. AB-CW4]MDQ2068471.1 flagellar protein export ATPase FliI [Natronospira sp. AB-CW4]